MENIYSPESYPHVSHKIKLGEHFKGFRHHLSQSWMFKESSEVNSKISNLQKIGAMMNVDEETINALNEVCGIHHFYPKSGNRTADMLLSRKQRKGLKIDPKDDDELLNLASLTLASAAEQKTLKSHRKIYQKRVKDIERSAMPKFDRKPNPSTEIKVPEDFVLLARVFKPYDAMSQSTYHTQDFLLRGSLDLYSLKRAITCENDKIKVKDPSKGKESEDLVPVKNLILSSMFYFGNTFYCDIPDIACSDYSEPIIEWMKSHEKIDFGTVLQRTMKEALFSDLEIRLGFPYVFKHLGECEHNIVFVDARLMTPDDPQDIAVYPLVVANQTPLLYCVSCDTFGSQYIVEDDAIPVSPALLCSKCYYEFYTSNSKLKPPKATYQIPTDPTFAPPDETIKASGNVETDEAD